MENRIKQLLSTQNSISSSTNQIINSEEDNSLLKLKNIVDGRSSIKIPSGLICDNNPINLRLTELEKKYLELDIENSKIEDQPSDVKISIKRLKDDFENFSKRFDYLNENINKVSTHISDVEISNNEFISKIYNIESKTDHILNSDIVSIEEKNNNLRIRLESTKISLDTSMTLIKETILNLSDRLLLFSNQYSSDISNNNDNLQELNNKILDLKQKISSLPFTEQITNLNSSVATIIKQLKDKNENNEDIILKIDSLNNKISDTSTELSSLFMKQLRKSTIDITEQNSKISLLSSSNSENKLSISDLFNKVSSLFEMFTKLDKELDKLNKSNIELDNKISKLDLSQKDSQNNFDEGIKNIFIKINNGFPQLKSDIDKLSTSNIELNNKISNLDLSYKDIQNNFDEGIKNIFIKINNGFPQLKSDIDKLTTSNIELNNKISNLDSSQKYLSDSQLDLKTIINDIKIKLNDLEIKNNDLETKNNDSKTKNNDSETKNNENYSFNEKYKITIEAKIGQLINIPYNGKFPSRIRILLDGKFEVPLSRINGYLYSYDGQNINILCGSDSIGSIFSNTGKFTDKLNGSYQISIYS